MILYFPSMYLTCIVGTQGEKLQVVLSKVMCKEKSDYVD